MHVDYLIIGQGISGTWLSYYLQKANKSFLVFDNKQENAASRVAAGVINPVTGRRHVEVWMAETLIPYTRKIYAELGSELGVSAISKTVLLDFFPTAQMRLSFQQRVEDKADYVSLNESQGDLRNLLNYEFGYGEIDPVYTVHLETILPGWRKHLMRQDLLLETDFDLRHVEFAASKIHYRDIIADRIIFCDGKSSAENPYFKNLPFAPNKGEALLVRIDDLPPNRIYKKGMTLSPLQQKDYWWIGSSYAWTYEDENPTKEFRDKTEQLLDSWLKMPFQILEHAVGIRPATLERRPFVGMHPHHPLIGILNGMGSKGCSLAPYFAKQLVDHLVDGRSIDPEASVTRFSKVLART